MVSTSDTTSPFTRLTLKRMHYWLAFLFAFTAFTVIILSSNERRLILNETFSLKKSNSILRTVGTLWGNLTREQSKPKSLALGQLSFGDSYNFSTSDDPRWLSVDRNNPQTFVYAAYYDDVDNPPFVRVLVHGLADDSLVHCLHYSSHRSHWRRPEGVSHGLIRRYHSKYKSDRGAFIQCPLLTPDDRPYAVSVVIGDEEHDALSDDVTTVLQVHYGATDGVEAMNGRRQMARFAGKEGETRRWNITKCFPCLHGYGHSMQLIQQLEVSRLFGVEHFFFYNFSTTPDVDKVLKYYHQIGQADVMDWKYPEIMGRGHYFHQFESIHDCLYRNLRSSKYILFGDLDEIAVPRTSKNIVGLLDKLFANQSECGAFAFLNTFFERDKASKPPKFPDSGFAKKHDLNMLLTHDRVNEIWYNGQRAKLAIQPSRIESSHIHKIMQFRGNYSLCQVPDTEGLLHHYRFRVPSVTSARHKPKTLGYVSDHYLLKFATKIVPRIKTVLKDLKGLPIK